MHGFTYQVVTWPSFIVFINPLSIAVVNRRAYPTACGVKCQPLYFRVFRYIFLVLNSGRKQLPTLLWCSLIVCCKGNRWTWYLHTWAFVSGVNHLFLLLILLQVILFNLLYWNKYKRASCSFKKVMWIGIQDKWWAQMHLVICECVASVISFLFINILLRMWRAV